MSKYTTMVRWVVEQTEADATGSLVGEYHKATYDILGLSSYPIFNESYRAGLNDKIIQHYYFREIGLETVALFRFMMKRTMNEIMPYYNKLYLAEDLVTDPLTDYGRDYDETWTRDDTTTNSGTTSSTGSSDGSVSNDSRSVFEDTPMSMMDTDPSLVEQLAYATNVTYDNGTQTSQNSSTGSGTSSDTGTLDSDGTRKYTDKGYNQSQSSLLKEYRDTMINIDMMVVNELEPLFMQIW